MLWILFSFSYTGTFHLTVLICSPTATNTTVECNETIIVHMLLLYPFLRLKENHPLFMTHRNNNIHFLPFSYTQTQILQQTRYAMCYTFQIRIL